MLDTVSPDVPANTATAEPKKTRRSYSKEHKARIVCECLLGERSIASIALEHGINANLLHKWIRQSHANDHAPRMVPVIAPREDKPGIDSGYIELSVAGATIRLFGHVEQHSISALLRALQ